MSINIDRLETIEQVYINAKTQFPETMWRYIVTELFEAYSRRNKVAIQLLIRTNRQLATIKDLQEQITEYEELLEGEIDRAADLLLDDDEEKEGELQTQELPIQLAPPVMA